MTQEHLRRAWRLLVVDDDEVDRMALRRLLSASGIEMEVDEARDVAAAQARLGSGPIDCLLVDYHLPDGDGRDVLRIARGLPRPPAVVMVTGQNDQVLAVDLMKDGADDYLTKGRFGHEELTRSIRYALGATQARQSERDAAAVNRALADAAERLSEVIEIRGLLPRVVDVFVPSLVDGAEIETPWGTVSTGIANGEGEPTAEHPLLSSDMQLGTLRLWRAPERPVASSVEVRLIDNLVDRVSAALDNARLYADLREQSRLVGEVNRVGRYLAGQLDPQRIAETVVEHAVDLTGARVGGLYLPGSPEGRPLTTAWWRDGTSVHLPVDEHALRGVTALEETQRGPGAVAGTALASAVGASDLTDVLAVPFATPDGAAGVLMVGRSDAVDFRASDQQMVEGIAGWAAIALGNAELFRQTDAAVRARDEVIGIVSHDLRNPLNVIQITSAMMVEMGMVVPDGVEHVQRMRKAATGMNRLIRDLLDVTRIDAGGLSVQPERVPVDTTLQEVVELMGPQAREAGIELVVDGVPGLRVTMDHERMVQLLGNLVSNAIKVMTDGGRITVGVREDGDTAEFVVADTGPGIPPDEMPHLFDRFWQGSAKRKDGAGLGLAICRGIAEAHGGTIHAESSGRGAVFTVRIPLGGTA